MLLIKESMEIIEEKYGSVQKKHIDIEKHIDIVCN